MSQKRYELNYDRLSRDYIDNLQTTLRNFTPGPEFLETWVYEENANSSVLGIFESAAEANVEQVRLSVSRAISAELDLLWLQSEVERAGSFEVHDMQSEGIILEGRFGTTARQTIAIGEPYTRALEGEAEHIRNERVLPEPSDDLLRVAVSLEGAHLECLVCKADQIVTDAVHRGASDTNRVLLDGLCSILRGRTLLEGHDHAVARLEYKLRDILSPHPVAGVITPENADPAFRFPQRLVRALYHAFCGPSEAEVPRNNWDDSPTAAWADLDMADKLERAGFVLEGALTELGLPPKSCKIVDVRDGVRLVVAWSPEAASLSHHLIKLERVVRRTLDARLELQMESKTDQNKRVARTKRNEALRH